MIILCANYYYIPIFSCRHSIITKINFVPAKHSISCVLLQSWSSPPSEFTRLPVAEVLLPIVVRVPDRVWSERSTCVSASEDLVPHVRTCVDTDSSAPSLDCCDQFFDVLAVGLGSSNRPWAAWTWVSFNIKPDSSSGVLESWSWGHCLHFLEIVNQFINLYCRIFSSAREHVDIGGQSCLVGLLNEGGSIGVDGSVAVVCSDDGVVVAILDEAWEVVEFAEEVDYFGWVCEWECGE